MPAPGDPRSSPENSSGSKTACVRIPRTASRPGPRAVGQQLEAGVRVDPPLPGPAIGVGPSSGSPEAWASRCRTVEPGGPAASSRSIDPSSAAMSAASAVTGFVTDAQATRALVPVPLHVARSVDDPDRDLLGRPRLHLPQRLHAARYYAPDAGSLVDRVGGSPRCPRARERGAPRQPAR